MQKDTTELFCSGDPDLAHRAMLNDFGLVQHTVFESPDHNTVHLIYGHTNVSFVHTELTKELKIRTGLQLVPTQSRIATSSSKGDGVVIVIVDSHDSLTDRLLREAVETAGHPDTTHCSYRRGSIVLTGLTTDLPALLWWCIMGMRRSGTVCGRHCPRVEQGW